MIDTHRLPRLSGLEALMSVIRRRVDPTHVRLARGAFWSLVGTAAGQGLAFVAAVCAARLLGSERYGELALILSTVNLFATLAMFGLGMTATKHVAEFRQSDPDRAGRIIGLSALTACIAGLAVAAALVALAPSISAGVLRAGHLRLELQLSAITLFFAAFNGMQTGALTGFEAYKQLAFANGVKGFLTVALVSVLAHRMSVGGAVVGYGIAAACACVPYQILVRRQCRRHNVTISYRNWKAESGLLWRFSLPVVLAGLAFTPAVWWSNALLAARAGYSEVGIFAAAFQLQTAVLLFSNAVSTITLPALSNVVPERNASKYKRVLALNIAGTTGGVAVIAVPMALLAPLLMRLYGQEFAGGAPVLAILCLSTIIAAPCNSVGHAIWSLNAASAGMLLSLIRPTALVLAAYGFVHAGALGLALAYLTMSVVQVATHYIFMRRLVRRCTVEWAAAGAV